MYIIKNKQRRGIESTWAETEHRERVYKHRSSKKRRFTSSREGVLSEQCFKRLGFVHRIGAALFF